MGIQHIFRGALLLGLTFLAFGSAQATTPAGSRHLLASVLGGKGFLGARPKTINGLIQWANDLNPDFIGGAAQEMIKRYTDAVERISKESVTLSVVDDALAVFKPALDQLLKTKTGSAILDQLLADKVIDLNKLASATNYAGVSNAVFDQGYMGWGGKSIGLMDIIGPSATGIANAVDQDQLTWGQAILDLTAAASKAADDLASSFASKKSFALVLTQEDVTDIKTVANEVSQVAASAGAAYFNGRIEQAGLMLQGVSARAESKLFDGEAWGRELASMAEAIVKEGTCKSVVDRVQAGDDWRRRLLGRDEQDTAFVNPTVKRARRSMVARRAAETLVTAISGSDDTVISMIVELAGSNDADLSLPPADHTYVAAAIRKMVLDTIENGVTVDDPDTYMTDTLTLDVLITFPSSMEYYDVANEMGDLEAVFQAKLTAAVAADSKLKALGVAEVRSTEWRDVDDSSSSSWSSSSSSSSSGDAVSSSGDIIKIEAGIQKRISVRFTFSSPVNDGETPNLLATAVISAAEQEAEKVVPGSRADLKDDPAYTSGNTGVDITFVLAFPEGTLDSYITQASDNVAAAVQELARNEFGVRTGISGVQLSSELVDSVDNIVIEGVTGVSGGDYNYGYSYCYSSQSEPCWDDVLYWDPEDFLYAATWVIGEVISTGGSIIAESLEKGDTRDQSMQLANCALKTWRTVMGSAAAARLAAEVNRVNFLRQSDTKASNVLKAWLLVGTSDGVTPTKPKVNLGARQGVMQSSLDMQYSKAKVLTDLGSAASKKFQQTFIKSIFDNSRNTFPNSTIIEVKGITLKVNSGRRLARALLADPADTASTTVTIQSVCTFPADVATTDIEAVMRNVVNTVERNPGSIKTALQTDGFDVSNIGAADITKDVQNGFIEVPGVTEGVDLEEGGDGGMSDSTKLAIGLGVGLGGGLLIIGAIIAIIVIKKNSVSPA